MSFKRFALGIAVASALSLGGSSLALASGQAKAIRKCTTTERGAGPAARQLFVFSAPNLGGTCWVLEIPFVLVGNTWGGYDASEGLPNDDIESIWIGTEVHARFFWNSFNTHDEGGTFTWQRGGGTGGANLGDVGWGNQVSAVRLVYGAIPASTCAVQSTNLTIWDTAGAPGAGDCTSLSSLNKYPNPVAMAFRNDNMSAFASGASAKSFELYNNSNYGSWVTATYKMSCGNMSYLPNCGIYNYGTPYADNKVSSIKPAL